MAGASGRRGCSTGWPGCSPSCWSTRAPVAPCSRATGSGSSRSTSPSCPAAGCAPPRPCRRSWRRAGAGGRGGGPRLCARPHDGRAPEEWEDALLEALRVAVRRRMVYDEPVGVLLSGGLDSSLIVALLAEEGQRGPATFSIGFPDVAGREGDEFAFSDAVAERFGTDHRQIRVGTDELVAALPHAIAAMSEPMVSHDCVAFWLLSQAVREDRKAGRWGRGADEVLGG